MTEIPKAYDPEEVEGRIYRRWEDSGLFHAEPDPDKEPFCIVIPPPNVTGALHIGHALDNTLQDVLIRYRRMQGHATLWLPGTDHAGIATQNVVEKELRKEGLTRHDLGREKFVERVWEWKEKYGRTIIGQLKRLGSSCDWSRERFTMDEGLSSAVRKVFVDLYDEGLIYRGKRIINWCPRCETALSDIEVNHEDYHGELVRFRYPLEDGSGHVTVATTRLETMLGDSAIAVNPGDERYKDLVGKFVVHPFFERKLRIEADDAVDPSFGTGAVKITPAHDATDFEIGERHYLKRINIFDKRAHVSEEGGEFAGQDRYEARESIRKALQEKGLLEGTEPHDYSIGRCSRCNTVVEPWLSEQWFVRMQPLAEPAIEAVKQGRTRFYPERWTNYYLNWMEQIRDWCISRQLWWGHRIPVWYCDCGFTWAAMEDPQSCPECSATEGFQQDPDVLDTWFSSQLWPFSTLGWPDKTPDLEYFYPTSVIVPGYEIIHLWVSRMIMAGLHFMEDVPFRVAFIHGIVRDAEGRKMSKSLGNVVDPLELIDRYGADALRFTLAERATGQDIYLHTEWVEGARNFANKLWNAARFVMSAVAEPAAVRPASFSTSPPDRDETGGNSAGPAEPPGEAPLTDFSRQPPEQDPVAPDFASAASPFSAGIRPGAADLPSAERLSLADRWIISRWSRTAGKVAQHIDGFEIAPAARALYEFTWNELCDWYIEAAKLKIYGDDEEARRDTGAVLLWVLERTLRLLHPVMPFLTEEIWGRMFAREGELLMGAAWPAADSGLADAEAEARFESVQSIVSSIRSFRSEYTISPRALIDAEFVSEDPGALDELRQEQPLVASLAGLGKVGFDSQAQMTSDESGPSVRLVTGRVDVVIKLGGLMDLDAERERLGKAIAKAKEEMGRLSGKLNNKQFLDKAPRQVVEEQQRRMEEVTARHIKLVAQLEQLGL